MGYTPVFDSIYTGTLYGRWPTAVVWASLLPLADKRGEINLSYEAIAGMTGWPMDLLRQGIAALCEPDPFSRSDAEEGRRLAPLDPNRPWGWRVVNHGLYRERARKQMHNDRAVESGANAERMRTRRDQTRPDETRRDRLSNTNTDTDSNKKNPPVGQGGPGGKRAARAQTAQRLPDDFELTPERQATARAEAVNPEREFARFCDHWRAASGSNARKHNWDAAWRNWCRKAADMAKGAGSRRSGFDTADDWVPHDAR